MVLPGILVVVAAALGGFMLAGGKPLALLQVPEFVVILGIAFGSLLISTSPGILKRCFVLLLGVFKPRQMSRQACLDLLVVMFRLFALARKNGLLALEPHLAAPEKSDIISAFPRVAKNKAAVELLSETLRLVVDGSVQPEEVEPLMAESIETHEAEAHMPLGALRTVADALPGIGIVGAVLGIIITMAHIDGKPEEVGHHIASALVGTFLGVFGAYGILGPMIATMTQHETEQTKYLSVIKAGVTGFVSGASPSVAVEFARRTIFSFDRPTAQAVEQACKRPLELSAAAAAVRTDAA
jgi:chemotaxis protein MotA